MSYKPRKAEAIDIENAVSKQITEILSKIQIISTAYIEPGDVVIVKVDKDTEESEITHIMEMMRYVFKDNKGILLKEDVEIQILKKNETD